MTAGNGVSLRTHTRTHGHTHGWTDKRGSRNSYLDLSLKLGTLRLCRVIRTEDTHKNGFSVKSQFLRLITKSKG